MEFKVFLSCTSLVLLSHSVSFHLADITSLCNTSDSYWEVQEGKQDNTFTCTGLSVQDTVQWNRWVSANDNLPVGSCPPPPGAGSQSDCDRPYPYFVPSRTSSDSAVMLINPSTVDNRLFDKARLLCLAARNVTVGTAVIVGTAGCRLDYIYASENIACTVQFKKDMWAVSAQCTITKALSAQNRYRCEWFQIKLQDKTVLFIRNTTMSVTNYNGKYVSGSCNFTSDLPSEGQYMYRVNIVPGEVAVNASFIGSNEIRRPSATPTHTCPQYVPEGGDLNCTCSVSDLGSPLGVLQWNATGSTQLLRSNVQALDTGTYVCQLLWNNTLVQSVQYILNVAYGPKSVTPVVINRQPFDTNGSQIISLNCSVSGSNPPANITWIRSSDSSVLCNTQLCAVTPRPPGDDGANLECQARNPVTNKVTSSSVTISLNYPPTSPPVITGSASLNDSQPVYEGDNISLTCTVRGGKPVNATVITFSCPNKTDIPDYSTDSYSISSSLTLDPVSANNHGTCLCTVKWKTYYWYSRTVNWLLKVYTPPSVPLIVPLNTIDTSGRPTYPFMEGTNGTLYCYSNQTGRPEATYTWPVSGNGHVSGSNLTFYQLTREDKGRQVTCLASNSYTENKRHVDNATFVLNVYYEPVVTFTLVSDTNNCLQVSNQLAHTQCVVSQGKMVHINCTADSNPGPASILWMKENKDVFSNTSDLVITSANHTIHNGDYNCTVFTKQEQGDSRLPLTSSAILTVIVGYSPTVLSFTINSLDHITGTIRENSSVALKCLSNGRPTPSMRLSNVGDPTRVLNQSQPTGDISAEDQMGEVVFSIEHVPCEFSGVYRCEVNNTLGQDSQSRTLFVLCAPRGDYTTGKPLTITTIGGKGQLTFEMTAYPTPSLTTLTFLGGDVSGSHGEPPAKDNIIQASCSATVLAPATAVCSITVSSITPSDEGYYKAVFNNSLGGTAYKFYVKAEGQPKSYAAILGGILAAVAVIIAVIAAGILIRRRRVGNGVQYTSRTKEKQAKHKDADKEIIMNSACARSGDNDFEMTDNDLYAGSDGFAVKNSPVVQSVRGDYEDVTIGTTSVQSASLTGNENIKKTEQSRKKGQKKKKVEASLSMEPFKATDYENVAFEATQTDPADNRGHIEKEKSDSSVQHNKDGLIYLSLAFDKTKSAKPPPPKSEETEYVSIDPQKTASFQQHDIANS